MRLNEYVEKQRGKPITKEEARELLRTDHADAFVSKVQIYRGVGGYGDFAYIDPSKSKDLRRSASTSNYYTLMMDNSSKWSKYPKRSKSIICSTDSEYSDGFGDVYNVYPINGGKVGVCPYMDIWGSKRLQYSFEDISEITGIVVESDYICVTRADYDFPNMVKIFKLIDKNKELIIKEMDIKAFRYKYAMPFFVSYMGSGKTFYGFIDYLMDPDACDFSLVRAGNNIPPNREIWISDPCVLVKVGANLL